MSTDIVTLLKQGRQQEIWKRYCGFLDLKLEEFMKVQERLLLEQLREVSRSKVVQVLMDGKEPTNLAEFRQAVPLTEYADYRSYLTEENAAMLPRPPFIWSHTSGRSGGYKMVPYSREVYDKAGERIMSAFILAMARERGDVRLNEKDVLLYNTPPRPYASGVALLSVAERFPFYFVPSLEDTEGLSFQERMELSFQIAMVTGIDILGSITSVLVKIGERFAQGAGGARLSRYILHPKALWRLSRGVVRSRLAGRPLLPKDLWTVKGITCGGTDTAIYKQKIIEYWGVTPHELYASTETGVVAALQAWDRQGLYFFPDVVFLEFIPEQEWVKNREDPNYQPQTVLLDEVQTNQRYELVISSLHGGPFLRYRMRDLVRFLTVRNEDEGIDLPSMICVGRSDGLIDLAGFTGLMDESMIARAIHDTEIAYEEWTVRKEVAPAGPILHLYIEPREQVLQAELEQRVHANLKRLNPFYSDLDEMLDVKPLTVTLLPAGSFRTYMLARQAAGADLAHLKPPHMNASQEIINMLLNLGEGQPS